MIQPDKHVKWYGLFLSNMFSFFCLSDSIHSDMNLMYFYCLLLMFNKRSDKGYSAVQSKHAVCAFIKHNRYFYLTYSFTSIHSHAKKLHLHVLSIVDTAFSNESELISYSFLQDFSKGKGSSMQLICNAHTAFLLWRAVFTSSQKGLLYFTSQDQFNSYFLQFSAHRGVLWDLTRVFRTFYYYAFFNRNL